MIYPAQFQEEPEGGYTVTFRDMPGVTYGETMDEALKQAEGLPDHGTQPLCRSWRGVPASQLTQTRRAPDLRADALSGQARPDQAHGRDEDLQRGTRQTPRLQRGRGAPLGQPQSPIANEEDRCGAGSAACAVNRGSVLITCRKDNSMVDWTVFDKALFRCLAEVQMVVAQHWARYRFGTSAARINRTQRLDFMESWQHPSRPLLRRGLLLSLTKQKARSSSGFWRLHDLGKKEIPIYEPPDDQIAFLKRFSKPSLPPQASCPCAYRH